MKKLLLSFYVVCNVQICCGQQNFKFGPVGALNAAWFRINWNTANAEITPVLGFQVGLMADYEISKSIALQPCITYSGAGGKVKQNNQTSVYSLNYFNIPILIAIKKSLNQAGNIFVNTGPYIGIGVGGNLDKNGNKKVVAWGNNATLHDARRGDLGWCLGIGFEKNDFQFSLLYQIGVSDIHPNNNDTYNNRLVGIRVGYLVNLQ
ncbi:MAG: PorT family protein [Cytophagales bacterium]|nr:PorT family protein [Cytophagales bacterium]MDW8385264.1 outer membrane beta-barrel protein [Flammeovirgaceae bacterium]